MNLIRSGMGQVKAVTKAASVVADLWEWARAADELQHWPSQVEYAAYAKITDRQVRRRLDAFRAAFPGEQSPQRLAMWLHENHLSRLDRAAQVLSLAAPPDLTAAA